MDSRHKSVFYAARKPPGKSIISSKIKTINIQGREFLSRFFSPTIEFSTIFLIELSYLNYSWVCKRSYDELKELDKYLKNDPLLSYHLKRLKVLCDSTKIEFSKLLTPEKYKAF
jgi:hypothetical protein